MKIVGQTALVTGAGSGLGAACALDMAARGAKVALLDVNLDRARAVAAQIAAAGGTAAAFACDVVSPEGMEQALQAASSSLGVPRIVLHVAGIGSAKRIVGKDGQPAPLSDFERVVRINLVGTYNVARLTAAAMAKLVPLEDGERGVIVNTASVAAFDGQIGQEAYAASKGGVVSMTLPLTRDLAQHGIRAMAIAPGLFRTPLMEELPAAMQESLATSIPFPKRLGDPAEFAQLAAAIVENRALNGEVIRLDGALRMAPR